MFVGSHIIRRHIYSQKVIYIHKKSYDRKSYKISKNYKKYFYYIKFLNINIKYILKNKKYII